MSPIAADELQATHKRASTIRREARRRARAFAAQSTMERLEALAERYWWVWAFAWGAFGLWVLVGRHHG